MAALNFLSIPTKFGVVKVDFVDSCFYLDGELTDFEDLGGHIMTLILRVPVCNGYRICAWLAP
jgi:hypothetical protein